MDTSNIGQGRQFTEVTKAYDAAHGVAVDVINQIPTDAKLPTQQMPMAPQPVPYVISGGGR